MQVQERLEILVVFSDPVQSKEIKSDGHQLALV